MRLSIFCKNCNNEVASFKTESKELLAELLLFAHTNGHSSHQLIPRIDGIEGLEQLNHSSAHSDIHKVEITCLQTHCNSESKTTIYEYEIPLCLVAAVAIAVHASHEGHPLRIVVDNKQLHPPVK